MFKVHPSNSVGKCLECRSSPACDFLDPGERSGICGFLSPEDHVLSNVARVRENGFVKISDGPSLNKTCSRARTARATRQVFHFNRHTKALIGVGPIRFTSYIYEVGFSYSPERQGGN